MQAYADLAVHGVVRTVRACLIDGSPFQESVVEVERVLQPRGREVHLVRVLVLGGEAGGAVGFVPGAPTLVPEQEVVLFLKEWNQAHVIIGIQQGLFTVTEEKGFRTALRDFSWATLLGGETVGEDGYERMPLDQILGAMARTEPAQIVSRPRTSVPPWVDEGAPPHRVEPTRQSRRVPHGEEDSASIWALILLALGAAIAVRAMRRAHPISALRGL